MSAGCNEGAEPIGNVLGAVSRGVNAILFSAAGSSMLKSLIVSMGDLSCVCCVPENGSLERISCNPREATTEGMVVAESSSESCALVDNGSLERISSNPREATIEGMASVTYRNGYFG